MENLIKITEHDGKQAVSAKELHAFLEVETPFTMWAQRMIDYGFVENIDYQSLSQKCDKPTGGRPSLDYALTLETAKHWCMMQRSAKGMQARQYFIECEKRAMGAVSPYVIPQTYAEALQLAATQAQEIELQQKQLTEQAPKVLFSDAVAGSQSSCLIGELAKMITQNGYEIGEKRLFEWMRKNGYLGSAGERRNIPNQKYIEQGLFEIKKGIRSGNGGVLFTTQTPKVTGKGQIYFVNRFLSGKDE